MILLRFFYDGGTLCARRYSGGRASRTSPGETSRGAGHGGRRCPHAARFSARIGPNATSEAELFRSPCQRISLLVHERFRPVHGSRRRSGGRGDATPHLPARYSGRCSRAAWLDLVDFLRGGSCRDHAWPCVHISSPARGHLIALWVSRGGDNWSCKCLGLMSRVVLNSLLRVFPLKPLMTSTEG